MNPAPDIRICLAMLMRDEEAVITRALRSVVPWIDAWCIHDLGSSDSSADLIERHMSSLPGALHRAPFVNYANARNRLLSDAVVQLERLPARDNCTDLILMLDADEELWCFGDFPQLPPESDIGLIDVLENTVVVRQPRLFRANALPHYEFPVNEHLELNANHACAVLEHTSIKHHRDGQRHRDESLWQRDYAVVDAWLGAFPDSAAMVFTKAQFLFRQNNSAAAIEACHQTLKINPGYWQAAYLAAQICLRCDSHAQAAEWLERCVDIDPERPEPLLHLAQLHLQHGEVAIAEQLAGLVLDCDIPTTADYYEPQLYRSGVRLLLAEAAIADGNAERAMEMLEPLDKLRNLNEGERHRKSKLEDQAQALSRTTPGEATGEAASINDSESHKRPRLTIGMATYDDFHGVYFSIMSLYLYHHDALEDVEILVIDNNPESEHGKSTRGLCSRIPHARYFAAGEYKGTAVRELIFSVARGDWVVCMDCHVFLHNGAVARLKDYFAANPDSRDLLHGPLFYDSHTNHSTHMTPDWNAGFFGRWGSDNRGADIDGEPFEIPLQGMGLFACVKKHWLGFNHRFRGFGGEEGYIHEKFRQSGATVLCLPFLRWTHRFDRPGGTPYENRWQDRIRNYLIGWHELGLDKTPVLAHFSEFVAPKTTARAHMTVMHELQGPLAHFDTVYALTSDDELWERAQPEIRELGMQAITQRLKNEQYLPALLKVASSRNLVDVLILNAEHTAPAELRLLASDVRVALEDPQWDVLIAERAADSATATTGLDEADAIQDTSSPAFQLMVVRPAIYLAMGEHLTDGGSLDELIGTAQGVDVTNSHLKNYLIKAL